MSTISSSRGWTHSRSRLHAGISGIYGQVLSAGFGNYRSGALRITRRRERPPLLTVLATSPTTACSCRTTSRPVGTCRAGSPAGGSVTRATRSTAALGYDDQTDTDEDRAQPGSEQNETIGGRRRYFEHTADGALVFIRLQRELLALPEEVCITGVAHLPRVPGDAITSHLLLELPTASVRLSRGAAMVTN